MHAQCTIILHFRATEVAVRSVDYNSKLNNKFITYSNCYKLPFVSILPLQCLLRGYIYIYGKIVSFQGEYSDMTH